MHFVQTIFNFLYKITLHTDRTIIFSSDKMIDVYQKKKF